MRKWITVLGIGVVWLALGALVWVVASQGPAPASQGTEAVIASPRDNAVVRGRVVIMGTAQDPTFWKYEVHYAREPVSNNWVLIGTVREQPVVNGTLETWDTALVPDGAYSLRLRVVRRDGNYEERYVRGLSVANAQPTETPTPAVTEAPTVTPTPLPPTPTVIIQQPVVATPIPAFTPTPLPQAAPVDTPTPAPASFNPQDLGNSFCYGGFIVLLVFLALGALAALRGVLLGLWRLIRRE